MQMQTFQKLQFQLGSWFCFIFFENPALAIEQQFGFTYATLSVTTTTFNRMLRMCYLNQAQESLDIKAIADEMNMTLMHCEFVRARVAKMRKNVTLENLSFYGLWATLVGTVCLTTKCPQFLRVTSTSDHNANPFSWWKAHKKRFLTAMLVRHVLPIQATGVSASQSSHVQAPSYVTIGMVSRTRLFGPVCALGPSNVPSGKGTCLGPHHVHLVHTAGPS